MDKEDNKIEPAPPRPLPKLVCGNGHEIDKEHIRKFMAAAAAEPAPTYECPCGEKDCCVKYMRENIKK